MLFSCMDSPLWQAQQQVPLGTLLHEARDSEPACAPVALLIPRARADTERISHNLLSGRGVEKFWGISKAADNLHFCQWARGGSGEGAGRCARHVLAEEKAS